MEQTIPMPSSSLSPSIHFYPLPPFLPSLSPLCRHGILKAGDRILKIGQVNVTDVSLSDAVNMLQSSEDTCHLEIEYDVTVHGEIAFSLLSLLSLLPPLSPLSPPTHSLSLTHTHTLSLYLSPLSSHSLTHSLTLSLSLTHTLSATVCLGVC